MRVVDMHCDTVLELLSRDLKGKEASLYSNDLSIDLENEKGELFIAEFCVVYRSKRTSDS